MDYLAWRITFQSAEHAARSAFADVERIAAENTMLLASEAAAKRVLWAIGLSPPHHDDILSAANGVARIVETLRETLADPPPNVQEAVMRKIGLKYMGDGIYRANETPNVEFSGDAPLHGAASAGTKGYTSGDKK